MFNQMFALSAGMNAFLVHVVDLNQGVANRQASAGIKCIRLLATEFVLIITGVLAGR